MAKVEFAGQSARDGLNAANNPARLINLYREPLVPGGRGGYTLRSVPGMASFADLGRVFMRALAPYNGNILAVCGGYLYSITPAGAVTEIGSVGDSAETTIDVNTGIATIVANGDYYTWNGTTLTLVATGAVTDAGSVLQLGSYTLVTELNGRKLQWSNLAVPGTFNALNFASAEITDDAIIRGIVVGDRILLLKASGFEQWTGTGLSGADAFQRISGAQVETGLASYGLVTTYPNGAAMVGTDGKVHAWNGAQLVPVSTPPVEVALSEYGPQRMFYYERRGHGFICITFTSALAWCYDIATGEWHERAENDGPWSVTASTRLGTTWYAGSDTGHIATLSPVCRDFGEPLIRRAISRRMDGAGRFTISKVEAFPRIGLDVQNDDGDPANAEAMVSLMTSRDGGQTFGAEKPRSVGALGAYETRLTWRALGQFRSAVAQFVLSCPADVPLLAEIDVEVA